MGKSEEQSRLEGVLLGLKICKEMWAQGTISHENIYENEVYYNEMLEIEKAKIDSHSPTISETVPDTLQEGDWFVGTEEQYRKVSGMRPRKDTEAVIELVLSYGYIAYSKFGGFIPHVSFKKTQLTPEEFIRRAENTFKN